MCNINTFFTNGSFIVHCDMNDSDKKNEPIILSTMSDMRTSDICNFDKWKQTAQILYNQAKDNVASRDGCHL